MQEHFGIAGGFLAGRSGREEAGHLGIQLERFVAFYGVWVVVWAAGCTGGQSGWDETAGQSEGSRDSHHMLCSWSAHTPCGHGEAFGEAAGLCPSTEVLKGKK